MIAVVAVGIAMSIPASSPDAAPRPLGKLAANPRKVPVGEIQRYWTALELIDFRGVGLVEENGREIFFEGSRGLPPTATFDIASFAKSITAVAILRLARRGSVHLEDSLERFFPDAPQDKKAITIHQLLTHRSGLGNPNGDTAAGVRDRGKAVAMILATPLEDPPGTAYNYSNDGYTLLAAITEEATSKTWEDVVRAEVLNPAGMTHTSFLGERLPAGAALAESGAKSANPGSLGAQWGSKGGAGILSTAQDLKRFMDACYGGVLLGAEDTRELGKSYAPQGQLLQYSRVFNLRDVPGVGPGWSHGGANSDIGHYCVVEYYPQRRILLILMALDDEALTDQVAAGLRNVVLEHGAPVSPPGRRGRPARSLETMTLEGEGLRFTIKSDSTSTLLPDDPASTEFLIARSSEDRQKIQESLTLTRDLLAQADRLAASDEPLSDDAAGRFFGFWRKAKEKSGAARSVALLGAAPNWVDTLGGTLSFVRVERGQDSAVFRLYWIDGKLRARGGSAIPNPAPLRLIDFGHRVYGAWNPALGRYAELRLLPSSGATSQAVLKAASRSANLKVVSPSSDMRQPS